MLGAVSPDSFDTLHSYSNTFQMPFVTPWFPEKVCTYLKIPFVIHNNYNIKVFESNKQSKQSRKKWKKNIFYCIIFPNNYLLMFITSNQF